MEKEENQLIEQKDNNQRDAQLVENQTEKVFAAERAKAMAAVGIGGVDAPEAAQAAPQPQVSSQPQISKFDEDPEDIKKKNLQLDPWCP